MGTPHEQRTRDERGAIGSNDELGIHTPPSPVLRLNHATPPYDSSWPHNRQPDFLFPIDARIDFASKGDVNQSQEKKSDDAEPDGEDERPCAEGRQKTSIYPYQLAPISPPAISRERDTGISKEHDDLFDSVEPPTPALDSSDSERHTRTLPHDLARLDKLADRLADTKQYIQSLKLEEKRHMRSMLRTRTKNGETTREERSEERRIKRHLAAAQAQKIAVRNAIADTARDVQLRLQTEAKFVREICESCGVEFEKMRI